MSTEIVYENNHCKWIDCEAPSKEELKKLSQEFQIDYLMLEDTLDPNHLPKFEEENSVLFFLTRENVKLERKGLNSISDISTKLGIFVIDKTLITIHRLKSKSIEELKVDLNNTKKEPTISTLILKITGKVIKSFDDESIRLFENLDKLENEIFLNNNSHSHHIRKLYWIKRKSALNARILYTTTDWVQNIKRLDISDAQFIDLQDKYKDVVADFDHLISESNNMLSMFLAMSDQKANQVMKLLAIYSVYFLPITFIAGLYGMNFDFMPELHTPYGYYFTLGVMLLIVIITFIYFKRKKW